LKKNRNSKTIKRSIRALGKPSKGRVAVSWNAESIGDGNKGRNCVNTKSVRYKGCLAG